MISSLSIKNIALIQELNLELRDGLNILSGETGAGKSIIIDSINFVLGDRADRSLIRYGETSARVEVVFQDIKNFDVIKQILEDNGIDCEDDFIVVTRVMTADRSECRINRRIVNLSLLRTVVSLLVDTHTQNEHQSLFKAANHLKILDEYNDGLSKFKAKYQAIYKEFNNIKNELNAFNTLEERERELDMLTFQINEIERVGLRDGEEEELKNQRAIYYNSQKITSNLSAAYENLSGAGQSALIALQTAYSAIRSITQYDSSLEEIADRLDSASIETKDIAETLYEKLNSPDFTSFDIAKVEKRLDEIRVLKRKYGKNCEEINEFYETAKRRLDEIENAKDKITRLSEEKEILGRKLIDSAKELHSKRVTVGAVFSKAIQKNLRDLGMKNSIFEVGFTYNEDFSAEDCTAVGAESIEFLLSPNLGEPVKSLSKIASGGEMSRVMLAIKNVVAEIDNIDTLIFDEIDTGISGVIAQVVAEKLYNIAKDRQVIAITHLPQLASMADVNYLIEKKVVGNKTLTFLTELSGKEVFEEIMRLSGAVKDSEIGYSNAVELKNRANNYKESINK